MNEQEFIRRMRNKGVKLNDQQLKGAYRQYVKDPEPFRDLVGESKPDPFLKGLTGMPDTGTKTTTVPSGQAKIKEKFLWDDTIEPKEKKASPGVLTMEQALADNWKLMGKKPIPGISPYLQAQIFSAEDGFRNAMEKNPAQEAAIHTLSDIPTKTKLQYGQDDTRSYPAVHQNITHS